MEVRSGTMKVISVIIMLVAISLPVSAGEPLNPPAYPDEFGYIPNANEHGLLILSGSDSFYFPNDLFALESQDDQNFTYGMAWNWSNELANRHLLYMNCFSKLLRKSGWFNEEFDETKGLQIGLVAFTPDDLKETEIITTDRPYSSLVYATTSSAMNKKNEYSIETSLTLALAGTRLPGALQSGWHDIYRELDDTPDGEPYKPMGWRNQISNGTELTGKLTGRYTEFLNKGDNYDVTAFSELNLGYDTSIVFGAQVRIGEIREIRYASQAGYDSNGSGADKLQKEPRYIQPSKPEEVAEEIAEVDKKVPVRMREEFFFAGFKTNFVAYNGLLQGLSGTNKFDLNENQIEKVVHEAYIGFEYPISKVFKNGQYTSVKYVAHARTAEHKLADKRTHYWGEFVFTYQR